MSVLQLSLKREYFEAIRNCIKPFEYRLYNDYWRKRLENKSFDCIILTLGYPPKDDASKRLYRPWQGYEIQTITHPHFGHAPVCVFAIKVSL